MLFLRGYDLRSGWGRYLVRGKGSAHPSSDTTILLRPTLAFSEPGSITKEVVMSNQSDSAHTDRPNLEQKRKLAKDLLKAVKRPTGAVPRGLPGTTLVFVARLARMSFAKVSLLPKHNT